MDKRMRTRISNLMRRLGILLMMDKLRFFLFRLKTHRERKKFLNDNPGVPIPPAYLIYESFDLNYNSYYHASRGTASWLLEHFKKHHPISGINILDWGCGPARIVRHMPDLLDPSCSVYGTDYNAKSIAWDKTNIKGVNFNLNGTEPPLPYENSFFDIIYGISIFTHLPEDLHYKWFNELVRIAKPGAVLFLTLQGNAFKIKLTEGEMKKYDQGALIIRGHTKIGHRTYTAIHPPAFVMKMIHGQELLEHIEGDIRNGKPQQDIWIIRVAK